MALSSPLTVIGMVNGMIGGLILILPVDALHAGYVFSILVILITGAFSFYSCYLCVIHLGDQKDLDYAMYVHFNKNLFIKIVYDLTVFSNLLFIAFLYFQLICMQWDGILNTDSIAVPLVNAFVLFILIFILKYFDFGASIMAYGIISIVGYILFLIWVIASAPSGEKHWEPIGTGEVSLAAAMGGAFSIQTFFIPILKKNPKEHKYVFYTLLAYIIGSSAYLYIAFMGSFGILNRDSVKNPPQDIEAFFPAGRFELTIIQSIYLIHLYSVFPEFTLISKKRLFSIFRLKQTQKGKIPIPEIIYSLIFVGICLTIRLVKVQIDQIVNLNGSVIGFFFIYFLPAILHIRCLYFAKNKISFEQKAKMIAQSSMKAQKLQLSTILHEQTQTQKIAQGYRTSKILENPLLDNQKPLQNMRNDSNLSSANETVRPFRLSDLEKNKKQNQEEVFEAQPQQNFPFFVCNCQRPKKPIWRVFQLIVLILMICLGGFIMVNGLMTV